MRGIFLVLLPLLCVACCASVITLAILCSLTWWKWYLSCLDLWFYLCSTKCVSLKLYERHWYYLFSVCIKLFPYFSIEYIRVRLVKSKSVRDWYWYVSFSLLLRTYFIKTWGALIIVLNWHIGSNTGRERLREEDGLFCINFMIFMAGN